MQCLLLGRYVYLLTHDRCRNCNPGENRPCNCLLCCSLQYYIMCVTMYTIVSICCLATNLGFVFQILIVLIHEFDSLQQLPVYTLNGNSVSMATIDNLHHFRTSKVSRTTHADISTPCQVCCPCSNLVSCPAHVRLPARNCLVNEVEFLGLVTQNG